MFLVNLSKMGIKFNLKIARTKTHKPQIDHYQVKQFMQNVIIKKLIRIRILLESQLTAKQASVKVKVIVHQFLQSTHQAYKNTNIRGDMPVNWPQSLGAVTHMVCSTLKHANWPESLTGLIKLSTLFVSKINVSQSTLK